MPMFFFGGNKDIDHLGDPVPILKRHVPTLAQVLGEFLRPSLGVSQSTEPNGQRGNRLPTQSQSCGWWRNPFFHHFETIGKLSCSWFRV